MNVRMVINLLGRGLVFVGLVMCLPLGVALFFREDDVRALALGVVCCTVTGLIMHLFSRRPQGELRHREGFLFVALAWTLAGLLGAVPFRLSGYFPSYLDAFFETISGFTTTGASVLTNIEALPHGLLMWRSLTQWIGGMGIIVLTIAILPFLGVGGMQIFKAESPGPTMDKLKPRITETAKLLCICGMSVYDAACHAFATMATGGFSPRNASVAAYASPWVDAVITVFMLIAGTNFALHYAALNGQVKRYALSQEFRWYMGIFLGGCALLMWNTRHVFETWDQALRHVTFQAASILTTTGFATHDFGQWPVASQLLLLMLMIIGGCAGSTGGGVKVMRVGILLKYAHREILKLIHPNAVMAIKWDETPVSQEVLQAIMGFFIFYILILCMATLALSLMGLDIVTAFSAVIACMSNIGPGLAGVGPLENYACIPDAGKALLGFCMLVGRLELYTVLVVLSPAFWRA